MPDAVEKNDAGLRAAARCAAFRLIAALLALACTSPSAARAGDAFEKYGDVMALALPLAALGISAAKHDEDGALQLAATAVPTYGLTFGLKAAVHEERPDHSGNDSFPSGHASSAFLGASYLHYRYGWKYGAPAYVLATLVGASRVEADKHFVHDVLASILIANVSAYFLTDPENDRVFLLPYCDSRKRSFGIVASFRF
jgi:membrane-associated phospholipid phosphatase